MRDLVLCHTCSFTLKFIRCTDAIQCKALQWSNPFYFVLMVWVEIIRAISTDCLTQSGIICEFLDSLGSRVYRPEGAALINCSVSLMRWIVLITHSLCVFNLFFTLGSFATKQVEGKCGCCVFEGNFNNIDPSQPITAKSVSACVFIFTKIKPSFYRKHDKHQ